MPEIRHLVTDETGKIFFITGLTLSNSGTDGTSGSSGSSGTNGSSGSSGTNGSSGSSGTNGKN